MDVDHGSKMNLTDRKIRVLFLHEFRFGHKATEAANNICNTTDNNVLAIRAAQ